MEASKCQDLQLANWRLRADGVSSNLNALWLETQAEPERNNDLGQTGRRSAHLLSLSVVFRLSTD